MGARSGDRRAGEAAGPGREPQQRPPWDSAGMREWTVSVSQRPKQGAPVSGCSQQPGPCPISCDLLPRKFGKSHTARGAGDGGQGQSPRMEQECKHLTGHGSLAHPTPPLFWNPTAVGKWPGPSAQRLQPGHPRVRGVLSAGNSLGRPLPHGPVSLAAHVSGDKCRSSHSVPPLPPQLPRPRSHASDSPGAFTAEIPVPRPQLPVKTSVSSRAEHTQPV